MLSMLLGGVLVEWPNRNPRPKASFITSGDVIAITLEPGIPADQMGAATGQMIAGMMLRWCTGVHQEHGDLGDTRIFRLRS